MTGPTDARLLLVSGSTRAASTNTAVLRTVRRLVPPGTVADLYDGLATLPAFNPDDEDHPSDPVADLRARIATADALLFCVPEYAGTLPGSLKNLLDWTVGGGETYGKPVGWITAAPTGRGLGAEATLATVLGYVGAVPVGPACVRLAVHRDMIGAGGLVTAATVRAGLTAVAAALVAHRDAART
ncbi:MAG: NADPH-dependent FMN reductase [Frankia sp.]